MNPVSNDLGSNRRSWGPDEFWDVHGAALFAMACTLLADESEAARAVALGLADEFRGPDPTPTLATAARCIYARCSQLHRANQRRSATSTPVLNCLGELAWLQRSALGLCSFAGHTYDEAAATLGIPADAAAGLLVSGLQELARRTAAGSFTARSPGAAR